MSSVNIVVSPRFWSTVRLNRFAVITSVIIIKDVSSTLLFSAKDGSFESDFQSSTG